MQYVRPQATSYAKDSFDFVKS
ncbi:unnamed protein product, partial [Adineta steineri]